MNQLVIRITEEFFSKYLLISELLISAREWADVELLASTHRWVDVELLVSARGRADVKLLVSARGRADVELLTDNYIVRAIHLSWSIMLNLLYYTVARLFDLRIVKLSLPPFCYLLPTHYPVMNTPSRPVTLVRRLST